MNILMVTMQMHIGGAETHILELCRALVRLGHHVTLVSNGGVYADMLAEDGVRHITLPLHTKTPTAVARAKSGLDRCIREGARQADGTFLGDFEIVHAHARIPAWICGLLWDKYKKHPLMRQGKKVPLFRFVTTAHLNFSINPLWRRISRWGERTMSVSEDIVDYLVTEYGLPRAHIQTTINGIDMEKFSPDTDFSPILAEFALQRENLRLVYMSRLDEDRAAYAYSLARIAPRLAERFPNLDILIVGGGTEEEEIRRLAETSNHAAGRRAVTMTGGRSDTHLFCAAADVFVGVSRSALEAMAAARPVLVAGNQGALGSFDETKLQVAVDTNFCCRGCGDLTDDALYAELETMLSMSPEERAARGAWCREIIGRYYTADRMAADYVSLYENALAAPVFSDGDSDVILSGYYGFGNMGDESLLSTITTALAQSCPGVRITVLTRRPKKDRVRTGLRCVDRMHFPAVYREMRRGKLFLSGGGSLLQDVTSGKSMQYYAYLLALAKRRGMTTMVYANGIGPIHREKNRILAKRTLTQCDKISVRDPDSYEMLMAMGIPSGKVRLSADPAFLMELPPLDKQKKTLERLGVQDLAQGSYVVVSLRRLHRKRDRADGRLAETVAELCVRLYRERGLTTLFIPMQPQNDMEIAEDTCQQVCAAMDVQPAPARIVQPQSAEELLTLLTGAKMTIAMRLHCLIYAATAGIPILGLSYDPKIDALLHYLHQPYCYDAAQVDADTLSRAVTDILQNEDTLRVAIREAAEEMRTRCREDVAAAVQELQR